ncbi:MAG: undecaprenyl-diphosphate phosphatase [Spirochaetota bacterium]|nr:undecaprenyl-diphosphate phosphatase [Spirochaetota bacterium]
MLLELIFLAIIQGITEFLPVSSSGHLNVLAHFISFNQQHLLLYFLVLHAGTSFAAIYFFRKDLYIIFLGLWDFVNKKNTQESKDALKWIQLIIMVSIPTAIVGITLKSFIENQGSNLLIVGIAWIITAIILFSTKFFISKKIDLSTFTNKDAFLVGLAQSVALVPGISRSGSTITMALLLGATPSFAGKLSFLASFVTIFGALLLETLDYIKQGNSTLSYSMLFIGFIVAFIVGLMSLKFLINILKNGKLYLFSVYCFIIGILLLFVIL